jgi:rhodanese-related sulfurtransferase
VSAAAPAGRPAPEDDPVTAERGSPPPPHHGRARGVDALLAEARTRYARVDVRQAYDEVHNHGAVLVDTRIAGQRAADGTVPGALVVERNHLEWRFDPECDARLPEAAGYDVRIILLCDEGYASSLAAASLLDLGLFRATDVVGGFQAWRAAGLPVVAPEDTAPGPR